MGSENEIVATVGARVTISTAQLPERLQRLLLSQFTYDNPSYEKKLRMGYFVGNEPRRICTAWELKDRQLIQVPRGGYKKLQTLLISHGYTLAWKDARIAPPRVGLHMGQLEARENQLPGVAAMLKAQQGILLGQTGTGKTETGLTAIVEAGLPALIIVWNKDLLEQWRVRIVEKYKMLPASRVGIFGQGRKKFGWITIGMQQTLVKHLSTDMAARFGTVLMDECHKAPAETFGRVVNHFPARYRWGLTADEERKDGKHFITYDSFGDVLYRMQSAETIHEPRVHLVPTDYRDSQYEEDKAFTLMINRIIQNRPRNEIIARLIRNRLRAGRRVLLFTERVDAALYWAGVVASWGYAAGPLVGGSDHRDQVVGTLAGLQAGTYCFAAATTYADVGLDIPLLDCAIVTCPVTDMKRLNQQVGRVVRMAPGKTDAEVWILWDRMVAGLSRNTGKIRKRWANTTIVENSQLDLQGTSQYAILKRTQGNTNEEGKAWL